MKKFNFIFTVVLSFFAFAAFAQPEGDTEPGNCYAKCIIPDEYETVTEEIEVKPAAVKWEVTPAEYESVTEQVLVKPASKRIIPVPAEYETVTEEIEIKPETKRIIYVPAEFETVTEEIEVKQESKRLIPVAAEFETVTDTYVKKESAKRIEILTPKYETVTETVEVAPATTKWIKRKGDRNCLSANPEDCLVWCKVEVPAQFRTITKKVNVGCDGSGVPNQGCIVEKPIAEEVATRSYKKLTNEASFTEEVIPSESTTITKKVLKTPATYREEIIPAEYKTITRRVVKTPATFRSEEIPAEYGEVTKRVLKTPATYREVAIPAVFETVTKRRLVKAGGFTEWREVLCESEVTNYTIRQIQKALEDRGYDVGPAGIDNILGKDTKAALTKFQKDNGLPVGNLDFETLKALGIQY